MSHSTLTDLQSVGTTDENESPEDSCGCTALMPCFQHYFDDRGQPAVRRIQR